jgi:hypothetical protein
MKPRTFHRKKLTRAQKQVVPCLMAAVVEAEGRTVEECEQGLAKGRVGNG